MHELMHEWEDELSTHTFDREGREIRSRLPVVGYGRVREVEFNNKVDKLLETYLPVLEEYDLPLSYIRTILSIS